MSQEPVQASSLTGLVCEDADAAAQLIGGQLRAAGQRFMSGPDPHPLLAEIGRCLVIGQTLFLANVTLFSAAGVPIDIVIRRPRSHQTPSEWLTEFQMLRLCLERSGGSNMRCLALTKTASLEAAGSLGVDVPVLDPLPKVRNPQAQATVEGDMLRFANGQNTSHMPLSDANWWKVRQTARILETPDLSPDLRDIVEFANGSRPVVIPTSAREKSYLFIVSNGVGLGHLTRLLAVAEHLDGRILFWSYSQAAKLIAERGFSVLPRMTAEHLEATVQAWRQWEAADLTSLIGQHNVDAVIYDGSSPPPGVMDALTRPELGDTAFVWIRRGMWQADATAAPLTLTHRCDLVIEPGDLAAAADTGPTRTTTPQYFGTANFLETEPVVATASDQMLSRRKSRGILRHRSLRPLCLVNLGGDSLGDHAPVVAALEQLAPTVNIRFLWLRSPFSSNNGSETGDLERITRYPISPLLEAFDGVISAAGYNSFHEVLTLCDAPVLFAPTCHARLDDQYARARYAADRGWAEVLEPDSTISLETQLSAFFDVVRRKSSNRAAIKIGSGAEAIASAIDGIANSRANGEVA